MSDSPFVNLKLGQVSANPAQGPGRAHKRCKEDAHRVTSLQYNRRLLWCGDGQDSPLRCTALLGASRGKALPDDDLCYENAIIMRRFLRYPLIIDPSGQAITFLSNEFKDKKLLKTSFVAAWT